MALGHSTQSGQYSYLKLGVIRPLIAAGDTAFSIDAYNGTDIVGPGSRSRSIGLAVSQQVTRYNLEVFGLLRRYSYDDQAFDYMDSVAVFTGVRWKF